MKTVSINKVFVRTLMILIFNSGSNFAMARSEFLSIGNQQDVSNQSIDKAGSTERGTCSVTYLCPDGKTTVSCSGSVGEQCGVKCSDHSGGADLYVKCGDSETFCPGGTTKSCKEFNSASSLQ